jgi:hypothetical protein
LTVGELHKDAIEIAAPKMSSRMAARLPETKWPHSANLL